MKNSFLKYYPLLLKLKELIVGSWKKGLFHVFVANGLFAIVAFGSQLLVAKFLTDVELGYIKIFQSITQILSILAGMGLSTSVLVLCANGENEKKKENIFLVGLRLLLPISFVIWLCFIGLNALSVWSQIPEVTSLLGSFSFIVLITAVTAIITAYFQALRIFQKFAYLMIVTKGVSLVTMVALTWLYGFYGFMHGLWIGLVFSLIVNLGYLSRVFKKRITSLTTDFSEVAKSHFSVGVNGLGANLFGVIALSMDILMMNFLIPEEASIIGQYGFAAIIILGLNMFQGSIIQVALPYFSKHTNDGKVLKNLYLKYSKIHVLLSIIVFVFLLLSLPGVLNFLYSDKFDLGVSFLQILLFVWFFRSCNAINIAYLTGVGKTSSVNLMNFIYASAAFLVTYIGIKFYSIEYMVYGLVFVTFIVLIIGVYLSGKSLAKRIRIENNCSKKNVHAK